jgi:hypothetical protein
MKTSTLFRFASMAVISTSLFAGCASNAEKEATAAENVTDAKQELQEVKKEAGEDAVKTANAEEWQAFKTDAETKIKDNDIRIAELKEKMKKSGKTMDAVYEKKIDNLQERNKDLEVKLQNYEKSQSDWESFKTEFNHDMDEFGKAFKDLTVDNKK